MLIRPARSPYTFLRLGLLVCLAWVSSCVRAENAHAPDAGAAALNERFAKEIQPVISKNCMPCHSTEKKKAGIIVPLDVTVDSFSKDPSLWEKIRDQVETKTMPPEEREAKMSDGDRATVLKWVGNSSDYVDAHTPLDPGFVAPRRLNRTEYNNTMRDLVGVDFRPADGFPSDDSGYGFDNIADVLTMSPLLVEKYLESAEKVMERAIPAPGGRPVRHVEMQDFIIESVPAGVSDTLGIYSNGAVLLEHTCTPGAEYEIRVIAYQQPAGNDPALMELGRSGVPRQSFRVEAMGNKPGTYSHKFVAQKSEEMLEFAFTNDFYDEKAADPKKRDRNLVIKQVEIVGPMMGPTPAMRRIFFVQPSVQLPEAECAKQIIERFATRAFRRPPTEKELSRLVAMYENTRKGGKEYEAAIKTTLTAVLVNPNFLFRMEHKPENAKLDDSGAWDLSSYEIASRMSYFLWSTMPDEELFTLCAQDKLKDPAVREAQVKRMLKDPRAKALAVNFAGQWLELRNLEDAVRDSKKFPGWGQDLVKSMRKEAELFFENMMREDRPVLDLINADYTFVDDRLAKLYNLKPVGGSQFKKVSLAGSGRSGVLGMAAVLTITSNPNRTSPVKRGKYVLEELLGTPPPPAPPNVPKLSEKQKDTDQMTLRKRFEAHRADPSCAACHARMDGIGFALERFDAIGKIREKDGNFPIDDEGLIPGASAFKGLDGLKKVLNDRKDLMLKNMTRKLLTYALGRGMGIGDRRSIDQCVKQAEANKYSFSALTLAIVNSPPFLKRREPRGDE